MPSFCIWAAVMPICIAARPDLLSFMECPRDERNDRPSSRGRAGCASCRRERVRMPRIEESAFLPAALEVAERPVSPTLRATAWLLIVGLIATTLWLVLGKVDVVATAQGRITQPAK